MVTLAMFHDKPGVNLCCGQCQKHTMNSYNRYLLIYSGKKTQAKKATEFISLWVARVASAKTTLLQQLPIYYRTFVAAESV